LLRPSACRPHPAAMGLGTALRQRRWPGDCDSRRADLSPSTTRLGRRAGFDGPRCRRPHRAEQLHRLSPTRSGLVSGLRRRPRQSSACHPPGSLPAWLPHDSGGHRLSGSSQTGARGAQGAWPSRAATPAGSSVGTCDRWCRHAAWHRSQCVDPQGPSIGQRRPGCEHGIGPGTVGSGCGRSAGAGAYPLIAQLHETTRHRSDPCPGARRSTPCGAGAACGTRLSPWATSDGPGWPERRRPGSQPRRCPGGATCMGCPGGRCSHRAGRRRGHDRGDVGRSCTRAAGRGSRARRRRGPGRHTSSSRFSAVSGHL